MPPPPTPNASNPNFLAIVLNNPPNPTANPNAPQPTSTTTSALPPKVPHITPTQRSLQARAKPYNDSAAKAIGEPYEQRQRRDQAADILSSVEMLVWYSNARNESLSQTRQHFQNIVLGIEDGPVIWREEYEVPLEQRIRREGSDTLVGRNSQARSGKGKKRV